MKRIITLAAIAIAVALPTAASAADPLLAGQVELDFTSATLPLSIIMDNILANEIPFISVMSKANFLNSIQQIGNYRDAANYQMCGALAANLATVAQSAITDPIIKNNVSVILEAVAAEYTDWPTNILLPAVNADAAGIIDEGTSSGCLLGIHIERDPEHFAGCEEKWQHVGWHHIGDCRIRYHWIFIID